MRGRDSNRKDMIDTVIEYCDKNSGVTSGIGAFGVALGKVKAARAKIDKLREKDGKWCQGVTNDIRDLRKRMSEAAVKCGSAVSAYARSVNNNTLLEKVNYTMEDLRKKKKDEVDDVCQNIHDAAQANMGEAVNWGIDGSDVSGLQGLIDEYRQKMQMPREAIIEKKGANRQVKKLVREVADELLAGQLDLMVNTLKVSNFNFWNGYQMARNIIDRGTVHTKIKGVAVDEEDVPLKGLKMTVSETGTDKVVGEAVSGEKGVFSIMRMAVGSFDFTWELEGYETRMESNVRVGAGKVVKRKVRMRRVI